MNSDLIDLQEYEFARQGLGEAFVRILGYFREDGTKSVAAVEDAMRARNAVALVIPAHTLKGEARQFGALKLAGMAEHIELTARRCVEHREGPEELIEIVADLRPCFSATMNALEQDSSPLVTRKVVFGRKSQGTMATLGGR